MKAVRVRFPKQIKDDGTTEWHLSGLMKKEDAEKMIQEINSKPSTKIARAHLVDFGEDPVLITDDPLCEANMTAENREKAKEWYEKNKESLPSASHTGVISGDLYNDYLKRCTHI